MAHHFHQPKSGEVLGGTYQLTEQIAQGGFASVWEATRLNSGELLAIKFMLPTRMNDEATVKRFRREAKLMQKLSHPNIVKVLDYGVSEPDSDRIAGVPFLVMEYLRGHTLEQKLEDEIDPMSIDSAIALMLPVLDALEEAHGMDIIHRDLKPDNIFIANPETGEPNVKLLDFGICKTLESSPLLTVPDRLTKTDQVFGTPDYMAPEQIAAEPLSAATDVYSIGIMLFELLTGWRPFMSNNAVKVMIKHLDEPMPELPGPYKDHPINTLVLRCTSKNPVDRFRSAGALKRALIGLPPAPEGAVMEVTEINRARIKNSAKKTTKGRRSKRHKEDIGVLDTLDAVSPKTKTNPLTTQPHALLKTPSTHRTHVPTIAAIIGAIIACAIVAWMIISSQG